MLMKYDYLIPWIPIVGFWLFFLIVMIPELA